MNKLTLTALLALFIAGCSTGQLPQTVSESAHTRTGSTSPAVSHIIYFEHDSSIPPGNALDTIQPHVEALIRQPRRKLLIHGSADPSGELNYNFELSSARAEAIKILFINEGVSASQLITGSSASEFPYWPGISPDERRRVTLIY